MKQLKGYLQNRRNRELRINANEVAAALSDCLSTFRYDKKEVLVTEERQEAWKSVLERWNKSQNQSKNNTKHI